MNYDEFVLSADHSSQHNTLWSAQTMFIHTVSEAEYFPCPLFMVLNHVMQSAVSSV